MSDTLNKYITLKKRSLNPNANPLTWQEMNENLRIIESHINEPIQVVNQEEFDMLVSSDRRFFVQFNDRLYYKNGAGQAVGILTEEDMSRYILRSLMGEPGGVATLDSESKVVQDIDCGEY